MQHQHMHQQAQPQVMRQASGSRANPDVETRLTASESALLLGALLALAASLASLVSL